MYKETTSKPLLKNTLLLKNANHLLDFQWILIFFADAMSCLHIDACLVIMVEVAAAWCGYGNFLK